jgi:Uma2 family endonuclease
VSLRRTIAVIQTLEQSKADYDRVTLLPDRSWEQFKLVQKGLEGSPGVRLAYYEGVIEIFMPGQPHEYFKSLIGFLIELFFLEQRIRIFPTGSVTQEKEGEVSAQADESYCIRERKPIPDVSIEVIFTSGSTAKLKRYQALGVPEVWFWEDGVFSLHRLRENGYIQINRSQIPELAGLDVELLTRCVLMGETDWLEAVEMFRRAIAQTR